MKNFTILALEAGLSPWLWMTGIVKLKLIELIFLFSKMRIILLPYGGVRNVHSAYHCPAHSEQLVNESNFIILY